MTIYWLDSSVLIESEKGMYARELVPKFWDFLSTNLDNGTIRLPSACYEEIVAGNDDVAKWCKLRKNSGFFCVRPSREVQDIYARVAEWTVANNKPHVAQEFLRGADGWLIAHAIATPNACAVTEELRNKNTAKLKIPTVAKHHKLRCLATHEMCRALQARF